jgi:hypothetical protein
MEMRDILEIQQLMALYGHAVDASDQSMFPSVFTEDAVFDARATGWGLFEGREAIAAWFGLGKPPHPPSHHMTNAHVYEAGGETRVRSKWLIIDRRSGGVVSGDYDDIVVRTAQGWRIKCRSFLIRHPVNYEGQKPSNQS